MRIVLLTQDEPAYLGESVDYLLSNLPSYVEVVGAVVFDVAPFGKRASIPKQAWRTYNTFGLGFFLHYTGVFLASKLGLRKTVQSALSTRKVPIKGVAGSINDPQSIEMLRDMSPDLLISIAGNQVFKRPLIDVAPLGCLNLHTSLLPKYRGLMPTFWVLANDEKETGVSVFYVDEEIDNGPILVQERVKIDGQSQADLIRQTKRLGMDSIIRAIEKINLGETSTIPNPREHATYFSEPRKVDVAMFRAAGKRFY